MYTVLRLLLRINHSCKDVTIAGEGLDNAWHLRAVRREGSSDITSCLGHVALVV